MGALEKITRNPLICGGQPVFKGTRVLLRTVLAYLANGKSPEQIIKEFPSLTHDDIWAAIAFAASAAAEDVPSPQPVPVIQSQ
ncbi:DUF433 domain-containing protein [bacterium]|nr:DUF433 domain-containing protein [bacterium]